MQPKFTIITAAALLLSPALALAAEGSFNRTLNINGPANLSVNTGSGYIHISPGSDNQVHIVGRVKASNNGWSLFGSDDRSPDERVKKVVNNPPIVQQGNTIRIGKQPDEVRNVSIDYEITTPANSQVDVDSGSGDIRISRIVGGVKAGTGSGNVEASEIGGYVSLGSGSGDIRAELASARDVKAQTGSGSIHLRNVQGALKAGTGSGDIDVSGQPTSPWKLGTGSGSLTLNTGSAHYTLDASTGSGSVHSDRPMTTHGTQEHHHLSGDINGGGPMVRLETGSGNITIH